LLSKFIAHILLSLGEVVSTKDAPGRAEALRGSSHRYAVILFIIPPQMREALAGDWEERRQRIEAISEEMQKRAAQRRFREDVCWDVLAGLKYWISALLRWTLTRTRKAPSLREE
jgi:hypothetical protein